MKHKNPYLTVFVRNNDVEKAIEALKQKLFKSGTLRELKDKRFYMKPGDKERQKHQRAVKRLNRKERNRNAK